MLVQNIFLFQFWNSSQQNTTFQAWGSNRILYAGEMISPGEHKVWLIDFCWIANIIYIFFRLLYLLFQGDSLNVTLGLSHSKNWRVCLPSLLGTTHTDKNKVHWKLLVHCLALRNTTTPWEFSLFQLNSQLLIYHAFYGYF